MERTVSKRDTLKMMAGGAVAALALPHIARADTYPSRPLTMLNPFPPGGYTDNLARAIATGLQRVWGQPIDVIDMPGGDGMLGFSYYLARPNDGYTLLCAGMNVLALNVLIHHAPFKVEDFYMVNIPARDYTLMATSAENKKLKSLNDVVQALKADPHSLSIGVQAANPDYINLALFANAIGLKLSDMRIVTYDGGQLIRAAVLGNIVDLGLAGGDGFLPFADQVTPLLTFDSQRHAPFNSPSVKEVNIGGSLDDFVIGSLRGFGVTTAFKNKYPDRFAAQAAAYEKAFKDPQTIAAMNKQQLESTWFGVEDSNAIYNRTYESLKTHVALLKGT